MTHGSLYSGIGGWLLAAKWAGIENIFTCEIDDFCNKVLNKHFPNVEKHRDIKEFKGQRGSVDIISTSDPCQPFSFAGKRGGKADDRYLWPQTIRVIREIKPSYVVFENVPGFINMAFETVASDLEAEGYTVESFIIPACAVGAWHRRDRLWIIAYSNSRGRGQYKNGKIYRSWLPDSFRDSNSKNAGKILTIQDVSNTKGVHAQGQHNRQGEVQSRGSDWWKTEPDVGRVANGIPSGVDRLKSLGNSIVPQIAFLIFEAIKQHYD